MTVTTDKNINIFKNAQISMIFEVMDGYLIQDEENVVFIYLENNRIKYVVTDKETDLVAKAIYAVESEIDSLGLDLKNNTMDQELVREKLVDAFSLEILESEFDIINQGEEITSDTNVNDNSADIETADVNPVEETKSSNKINAEQRDLFEAIFDEDEVVTPTQEEVATANPSTETPNNEMTTQEEQNLTIAEIDNTEMDDVEATTTQPEEAVEMNSVNTEIKQDLEVAEEDVEVEANLQTNESDDVTSNIETILEKESLSREEKRIVTKAIISQSITNGVIKLKEIIPFVQDKVDVSDTHIRNMAEELVDEGKIEKCGRGKYCLPGQSQLDTETKTTIETTESTPNVVRKGELKATKFPLYFDKDDEVREYLEELELPASLVNWVLEERKENRERIKEYPQRIANKIPEKLSFLGAVKHFRRVVGSVLAGQPILLDGPAGVGKTTLLYTVSTVLNKPLFIVNGSGDSSKDAIVGEITTIEKGLLGPKDGPMTEAAVYGGIFYFDEINMSEADVNAVLNPFTDDQRQFYNDARGEDVKLHPKASFVAAMNADYIGVKEVNEALLDRMVVEKVNYLGRADLKKLIRKIQEKNQSNHVTELSEVDIEKIASVYAAIIAEVSETDNLPKHAASVRNVVEMVRLVPVLGFSDAVTMIANKFGDDRDTFLGVLENKDLSQALGLSVKEEM